MTNRSESVMVCRAAGEGIWRLVIISFPNHPLSDSLQLFLPSLPPSVPPHFFLPLYPRNFSFLYYLLQCPSSVSSPQCPLSSPSPDCPLCVSPPRPRMSLLSPCPRGSWRKLLPLSSPRLGGKGRSGVWGGSACLWVHV